MKEQHPDDPNVEYVPHGFDPETFLNHYPLSSYRDRVVNGDATAIIEAFIEAHNDRCYPRWLLASINEAFMAYWQQKKLSLDDAFGLSPAKWTAREVRSRRSQLAYHMYLLTAGLQLSLAKAAEMVELKNEADLQSKSWARPTRGRIRSYKYTADSLKDKYGRKWKEEFKLDREPPIPPSYHGYPHLERSP